MISLHVILRLPLPGLAFRYLVMIPTRRLVTTRLVFRYLVMIPTRLEARMEKQGAHLGSLRIPYSVEPASCLGFPRKKPFIAFD